MNYSLTRAFALSVLVILSFQDQYAQTISASPYSVYGVGVLKGKTSALNRSMAGTGIGIRDPINLNNLNPASYTSIQTVTQVFETGMFVESDYYQTKSLSNKSNTGNLTGIDIWLRFSKRWAGTVGLAPFSSVDYNVASTRRIGGEQAATVSYEGSGGITQLYFGNGFQVTKNLALGFNASYIFGHIEKNEIITSGLARGTVLSSRTFANRASIDFGGQYTLFLKKDRSLTIGATYDNKVRLNASREIYLSDSLFVEATKVADFVLPRKIGGGLAFQSRSSTIAADLKFSEWSKAKLEDNVTLRNTMRFSLGYEYKGKLDAETYWNVLRFRSGVYIQDNYLVFGNTSFADWGWSAGIGFPLDRSRGLINLTYNYNQSGTTANSLVKQRSQVLVLDITFRDLWGIRRKFD